MESGLRDTKQSNGRRATDRSKLIDEHYLRGGVYDHRGKVLHAKLKNSSTCDEYIAVGSQDFCGKRIS